jgi:thiol-disulfide isomerase/thioredoxin
VLLVSAFTGNSGGPVYVDGNTNAVLYPTGHQPLAPEFTGTTLTGSTLHFSSYRGKVVVLNFWGSWCVPCRSEAETLAVVAEQYQAAGVSFLGVDLRDSTANGIAFVQSHDIKYPSVSDPDDLITLDFTSVVPIIGTPTTLVIDRTGHIAGAIFDEATYSELTAILNDVTGKK